jgi:CheY-like chemotaxis protein
MRPVKTIYLVDDDEDWRFIIKDAIKSSGFDVQVVEADNGLAFLNILPENVSHSAILMDINMPMMNGIEALNALKNNPNWASIPLILMSSAEERSIPFLTKEVGVNKFVTKPIHIQEHIELVEKLYEYCQ